MDSGASLHMLSKNKLTSGEKDTIRRQKNPTGITAAYGQAEPTEETTGFRHNDTVGRFTSSAIFGFL